MYFFTFQLLFLLNRIFLGFLFNWFNSILWFFIAIISFTSVVNLMFFKNPWLNLFSAHFPNQFDTLLLFFLLFNLIHLVIILHHFLLFFKLLDLFLSYSILLCFLVLQFFHEILFFLLVLQKFFLSLNFL